MNNSQLPQNLVPVQKSIPSLQSEKRICLVEDDSDIQKLVTRYLEMEGFQVRAFSNWAEVTVDPTESNFDLLVLDWMLPGKSGLEILREIRQSENPKLKRVPVLMVTARVEDADIIRALEAGADDYVTKPFSPSILVARTHSLLRRLKMSSQDSSHVSPHRSETLLLGKFRIDKVSHRAFIGTQEVSLTPSEFGMMVALIENAGSVLTRNQLIERLKGPGVNVVERTVDNYVLSLRKKLGESGNLLETVRGIGYRVVPGDFSKESLANGS